MELSAPDLPDFRQVAVNVAPEHLQFIVCKVWINFFHGIEEFRNLHVLIQILRLCRSRNTKHWNWRKNWIRIKESQWGRDSCRVFLESLKVGQRSSSMRLKRLAMPFIERFSLPIFSWTRRSNASIEQTSSKPVWNHHCFSFQRFKTGKTHHSPPC